jgi:hypothetical protein
MQAAPPVSCHLQCDGLLVFLRPNAAIHIPVLETKAQPRKVLWGKSMHFLEPLLSIFLVVLLALLSFVPVHPRTMTWEQPGPHLRKICPNCLEVEQFQEVRNVFLGRRTFGDPAIFAYPAHT